MFIRSLKFCFYKKIYYKRYIFWGIARRYEAPLLIHGVKTYKLHDYDMFSNNYIMPIIIYVVFWMTTDELKRSEPLCWIRQEQRMLTLFCFLDTLMTFFGTHTHSGERVPVVSFFFLQNFTQPRSTRCAAYSGSSITFLESQKILLQTHRLSHRTWIKSSNCFTLSCWEQVRRPCHL